MEIHGGNLNVYCEVNKPIWVIIYCMSPTICCSRKCKTMETIKYSKKEKTEGLGRDAEINKQRTEDF